MYLSMDEIGFENAAKIKAISSVSDRWRFIYDTARGYGFGGIHFTPSLYDDFGLDLHNIPGYFSDFKLTLHHGGLYNLLSQSDCDTFDNKLSDSFDIAQKHNMSDISLHPPVDINGFRKEAKKQSAVLFDRAMSKWEDRALRAGISISLETHVTGEFFLFDGLIEYVDFMDRHSGTGILIDISHNYFDNYSEDDIINIIGPRKLSGLHLSDSRRDAGFKKGTHLAIGDGTVDFDKLLGHFNKSPDLYGVLEIKSDNYGIEKSVRKLKNILE